MRWSLIGHRRLLWHEGIIPVKPKALRFRHMSVDWDWSRVVFDHVMIVVRDASASMGFYKTVLEPLAIPPLWESDRGAQFANLVVWSDERPSGPVHIAFVADSREQVDAFHRWHRGWIRGQRRSRRSRAVQLS